MHYGQLSEEILKRHILLYERVFIESCKQPSCNGLKIQLLQTHEH